MAGKLPKSKKIAEFGDFQTPESLARECCALLKRLGVRPRSIVEPTCGVGNFLVAALECFPEFEQAVGVEINAEYLAQSSEKISGLAGADRVNLRCESFFTASWSERLKSLAEPILLTGNPPWVTNSELGILGSKNLPVKKNFQNHSGLDAMTGKSNFDISEWMLLHLLERSQSKQVVLAMLCKTAVARKTLLNAWKAEISLKNASIFRISAADHFDAAVDACFLVCHAGGPRPSMQCSVYKGLDESLPAAIFGFRDGQMVADVQAYDRWKHLRGREHYQWRSGIKHDCSAVMELRRHADGLKNGFGECVELEAEYVYPMLKSSDLANGTTLETGRLMIVPQRVVGGDTEFLAHAAPKTWAYLQRHAVLLDSRGSSIYRNRPRFSIFGIGDYSFAPWKVAISGLYKSLSFRLVGPIDGRPVVLDDTCNFIPCRTEREAALLLKLLNSRSAAQFFSAFVFWDSKRPVTVDLLRKLDLLKLAEVEGHLEEATDVMRGLLPVKKVKRKIPASADGESLFSATI